MGKKKFTQKDIFVLNVIHTSNTDPVEIITQVWNDFSVAELCLEKAESEWIKMHRELKSDYTDEEFEDWLTESLVDDYKHDEGMYKSYIYHDGDEKVFSIEKHHIYV